MAPSADPPVDAERALTARISSILRHDCTLGDDIILSGNDKDFTEGGANDNETFAGPGDDFVNAGQGVIETDDDDDDDDDHEEEEGDEE